MSEMSRKDLLRKIQELSFASVEINLYLDNHPGNQKALNDYNKISAELQEVTKLYEKEYGPLKNFGCAQSEYPWKWVNEPWPWEL
jgi:spore coat protein JB